MNDELRLRAAELTENPSPRVPVCLVLDTSGSMSSNRKMDELNQGIAAFFDAVRQDEMANISAEIAIVTFDSAARQVLDFAHIDRQTVPNLVPSGYTAIGAGVNMALDLLEQAKRSYSSVGLDYYQPWLVLMTDGEPQGEEPDVTNRAIERCRDLIARRKLTVFPIAIGDDANLSVLGRFSPNLEPLRVQATDFKRFFNWLAKSINAVSMSNPGDSKALEIGENNYKRLSLDIYAQMTKGGGR